MNKILLLLLLLLLQGLLLLLLLLLLIIIIISLLWVMILGTEACSNAHKYNKNVTVTKVQSLQLLASNEPASF